MASLGYHDWHFWWRVHNILAAAPARRCTISAFRRVSAGVGSTRQYDRVVDFTIGRAQAQGARLYGVFNVSKRGGAIPCHLGIER